MAGLSSPAIQSSRGRRVLPKNRRRTESTKGSWMAVSRDRTTDIARHDAASVTGGGTVRIGLEFDVPTIFIFSDGK